MGREEKIVLFAAFCLAVASIVMIALFFAEQRPEIGYSQIYLQEGGYSAAIDNGAIVFSFKIENHEETDMNYDVEYLLGDLGIASEKILVEKGKAAVLDKRLAVPFKGIILPAKFTIEATNNYRKTYSVWFWLREIGNR